tara:strand:+ start:965 stop:1579 length:615 start_codon:yes stop_codon:yes gene_type:complete
MKEHKIKALRGYKAPRSIVGRPSILASNKLQREFSAGGPDKTWATDITYIRTWQGWLYLAVVVDLFSRRVVGWSMKPTLHRSVVLDALLMAVWRRRPKEKVLIHSDQGAPYASRKCRQRIWRYRMQQIMSRRGSCWDNASIERLLRSRKSEWIPAFGYRSLPEAQRDVADYLMGYYNEQRPHTFNGGVSPVAAEEKLKILSGIS